MNPAWALLAVACAAGLVLVPLGLPGLWLMLAAGLTHRMVAPASRIDWNVLAAVTAVAIVAEYLEFALAARYTRKYGGSKRAGWGALIGGFIGAIVGVPVPIIGSIIGAFAGSFVGALTAEYSVSRNVGVAQRAAFGSLVGRVAATAIKTAAGLAIAAVLLITAWS